MTNEEKHIFYHHERFGTHFDNYARKVVDEHKFYFLYRSDNRHIVLRPRPPWRYPPVTNIIVLPCGLRFFHFAAFSRCVRGAGVRCSLRCAPTPSKRGRCGSRLLRPFFCSGIRLFLCLAATSSTNYCIHCRSARMQRQI